ncbi:MAG TPA: hypothetical protein VF729_03640 [Solirubrobacterales bacterium]
MGAKAFVVLVLVLLAWVGATLDVEGYGGLAMIAVSVPVAIFAGAGAETWLRARRRRSLG